MEKVFRVESETVSALAGNELRDHLINFVSNPKVLSIWIDDDSGDNYNFLVGRDTALARWSLRPSPVSPRRFAIFRIIETSLVALHQIEPLLKRLIIGLQFHDAKLPYGIGGNTLRFYMTYIV
jgi:hypothetical protein